MPNKTQRKMIGWSALILGGAVIVASKWKPANTFARNTLGLTFIAPVA